jgi:hypothetical protein
MPLNYTQFSDAQIETLRGKFAPINSAQAEHLDTFRRIFDGCTDAALTQLAKAQIKFVSPLAINACVRRGINLNS